MSERMSEELFRFISQARGDDYDGLVAEARRARESEARLLAVLDRYAAQDEERAQEGEPHLVASSLYLDALELLKEAGRR
jgi:Na+/phosphate symporter